MQPLLDRLGVDFPPDTPVAEMSLAQQQLLEIVKALSLDARLVIMDEPTSSLTLAETDRLMRVIAGLKAAGVSVIFISHRLNEVEPAPTGSSCCATAAWSARSIAAEITRRDDPSHDRARPQGALCAAGEAARREVSKSAACGPATYPGHDVSLAVRGGEILGLAGLVGSGRTELARAVFGIDSCVGGSCSSTASRSARRRPRRDRRGIYLVPEDRKRSGLLLDFSVAGNISLPDLRSYARRRLVRGAEIENAERLRERLNIRTPTVATDVGSALRRQPAEGRPREVAGDGPRVLIFDEPTRGIDVGAKHEIYACSARSPMPASPSS